MLQLLHVLDWRPVLQQLSPVAAQIQSTHSHAKTGDESSLLDDDMTVNQPSVVADSASSQHGNIQSAHGLDAGAKAWAAQLLLLVLQAYVIMTDADMPAWISRLVKGDTEHDTASGVTLHQQVIQQITCYTLLMDVTASEHNLCCLVHSLFCLQSLQ